MARYRILIGLILRTIDAQQALSNNMHPKANPPPVVIHTSLTTRRDKTIAARRTFLVPIFSNASQIQLNQDKAMTAILLLQEVIGAVIRSRLDGADLIHRWNNDSATIPTIHP